MLKDNYQMCTKCVMDTTDPEIYFDDDGVCDHCHDFVSNVLPNWHPNEEGQKQLNRIFNKVKKKSLGKDYDCIMGMSGGLDSSYLLHQVVSVHGLRPLVFHVDAGWNSDIAVSNIQNIVDKLGLDLFVEVIDWDDMKDFQLALFKSGIPSLDIAQDHAFFAVMYHFALKHNIKYIINGGNHSTECCRNPLEWLYYGTDMRFVKDIRNKFCSRPLKNYPWSGIFYHKFYLKFLRGINVVKPLDLMEYNKKIAIDTLEDEYGWQAYPQKHFESRFTKFFEGYWLPSRFGYDMRKPQFSSLISTNQMSRAEALENLKASPFDVNTIEADFEFIANKLEISVDELKQLHELPLKSYKNYKNSLFIMNMGAKIMQFLGFEKQAIKR
jgi:N-acetyl sugar amidotransferase